MSYSPSGSEVKVNSSIFTNFLICGALHSFSLEINQIKKILDKSKKCVWMTNKTYTAELLGAQEVLEKMGDTLEQQLICPTCLELPIHPIILNCGHSYCWLCLQQWKKMSSKSLCPQCRYVIFEENRKD